MKRRFLLGGLAVPSQPLALTWRPGQGPRVSQAWASSPAAPPPWLGMKPLGPPELGGCGAHHGPVDETRVTLLG